MNWAYVIELALGLTGLISGFVSLHNKWAKYIAIVLMGIMVLDSSVGLYRFVNPLKKDLPSQKDSTEIVTIHGQDTHSYHNYGYGLYDTHGSRSFSGSEIDRNTDRPESCVFCSGTGKCHVCHGLGNSFCNAPACSYKP